MKRSLALALATFLGLALLSISLPVARNAFGGVTSWSGSYGTIDAGTPRQPAAKALCVSAVGDFPWASGCV